MSTTLSWRSDGEAISASENLCAVFLHAGQGDVIPEFADAQCRGDFLVVADIGDSPRGFMSQVLDYVMGPENYHPIDYQLFYMNLRNNAGARVAAYLGGARAIE